MERGNLSDAELKTLIIRMLKELNEVQQHKKFQSVMKDSLIEIKNNLQGNNSRMDEAENQINDRNIRKKNQPIRTTRKKNPKNMRIV